MRTVISFLLANLAICFAVLGVDVSSSYSTSDWECVKNSGRTFGIVRGWHSYGGFDSNVVSTVANGWAAGMSHMDVYMFPCAGKSASSQVDAFATGLSSNGVRFGQVWFDIETNPSPGCGWSGDKASNCAFMKELIQAGHDRGLSLGVYASYYMWTSIMDDSCTVGSGLPIWYAGYTGSPSFSDWRDFGGWTKPAIHQYSGTGSLCGRAVDLDYHP
jgi:GH25 family lysozyme M1 (1,4-beta-N-acetylmuramidase)